MDVELFSSLRVRHEQVDTGEIVGIEVILELLWFYWIIELRKIVLSNNSIEYLQIS